MVSVDTPSKMMGIPIKYLSLITLVVQNSAYALTMKYSQRTDYLSSTCVVMNELLKVIICAVMIYLVHGPHKRSLNRLMHDLHREIIVHWRETRKLAFPALCYLIQNNLQYVAMRHLDAATFQVTYQLKILTTAFFSVVMLNRSLNRLKWVSLGLLTVGIGLVQMEAQAKGSVPQDAAVALAPEVADVVPIDADLSEGTNDFVKRGLIHFIRRAPTSGNDFTGFLAVVAACFLSGLAGVYFEKLLKAPPKTPAYTPLQQEDPSNNDIERNAQQEQVLPNPEPIDTDTLPAAASLWIRNIQMSISSLFLGLVLVLIVDGQNILIGRPEAPQGGFFQNYTYLTWIVILLQAGGGLIVAVVVKYADNILKGFATSISIVLSSTISVFLFDFVVSATFLAGSAIVIYATYLYGV